MTATAVWTEQDRADFIAAARAAISGPRSEDAAANPARVPAPKARGVLNAGQSLTSILAALSRVGWGPLRGREFAASRAVLDTLASLPTTPAPTCPPSFRPRHANRQARRLLPSPHVALSPVA